MNNSFGQFNELQRLNRCRKSANQDKWAFRIACTGIAILLLLNVFGV